MNMDDDTQKEKIIIPSFRGAEDVSVDKSNCLSFWDLKTRSLVLKGSSLVALVSRGSIFVDEGLNLFYFNLEFPATPPQKKAPKITNASSEQTLFSYIKLPRAPSNF